MKKKSVLFIGMGAIGSLYASKCNMDLATIFCLARTDYSHIKNHGITILQPNKKEKHWKPTVCFNSLSQCDLEQLDFIVITTKAIDNEAILNILPKKLPAHLSIVLLQNGIDIEEPFIQRYPEITILSGVVNVCVTKIGAGYIHHQDYGRLVIGKYPSGEHQLANDFIQLFKSSDIDSNVSTSIKLERYKKLLWNAAFNPLSVIHDGKNTKQLCEDKDIMKHIREIMKEVQLIAKNDGCYLADDVIDKSIMITKKMKPYKTSMCIDWENQRQLEIEPILGNAVSKAQQFNCLVPALEQVYNQLKRLTH